MQRTLACTACITLLTQMLTVSDARGWLPPPPACMSELQGPIYTPADDAMHCDVDPDTCTQWGGCACDLGTYSPYNLEWWYWTGHLRTVDTGRWYGFGEIVYAAIDLQSFLPLHWADHFVSDIDAAQYYTGSRETNIGLPRSYEDGLQFAFPTSSVSGIGGFHAIHSRVVDAASGTTHVVDLVTVSQKAPVLQRADGLIYYYSRERMLAWGTIEIDGVKHPVTGSLWFDHQFGEQRAALQNLETLSWFALQLDDNRELVLYEALVTENETRPEYADGVVEGTLTDPNCNVKHLTRQDFEITPLGAWQSSYMPAGWGSFECWYPMGWRIRVPSEGIDVVVDPFFPEQEIIVPETADPSIPLVGDRYWEGAAAVTGSHTGRAFVEMAAFCPFTQGSL